MHPDGNGGWRTRCLKAEAEIADLKERCDIQSTLIAEMKSHRINDTDHIKYLKEEVGRLKYRLNTIHEKESNLKTDAIREMFNEVVPESMRQVHDMGGIELFERLLSYLTTLEKSDEKS